jgi:hypothetical protein
MADERTRAQNDVDALACPRGLDTTQLAMCLSSLRLQPCADRRQDLGLIAGCETSALCVGVR